MQKLSSVSRRGFQLSGYVQASFGVAMLGGILIGGLLGRGLWLAAGITLFAVIISCAVFWHLDRRPTRTKTRKKAL